MRHDNDDAAHDDAPDGSRSLFKKPPKRRKVSAHKEREIIRKLIATVGADGLCMWEINESFRIMGISNRGHARQSAASLLFAISDGRLGVVRCPYVAIDGKIYLRKHACDALDRPPGLPRRMDEEDFAKVLTRAVRAASAHLKLNGSEFGAVLDLGHDAAFALLKGDLLLDAKSPPYHRAMDLMRLFRKQDAATAPGWIRTHNLILGATPLAVMMRRDAGPRAVFERSESTN